MNPFGALKLWYQLRRNMYRWSREELLRYQQVRIRQQLEFLKVYSPYYRNLLESSTLDLKSLPIIQKQEFMENFNEINTEGIDRDEAMTFAIQREREGSLDLYLGKYSLGLSSGTSGNKTLTVLGSGERQKYGVALFARNGISGSILGKRILFALRTNNPAYMEAGKFNVKLYYTDYLQPLDHLVTLINEKNINVLAGPPSLLMMIRQEAEKLDVSLKTIISYAEVLSDTDKSLLEDTFKCRVAQIYQGAEGFIAHTCKKGNLHLNEDLNYFEFESIDPSNENITNVIVTDLYRRVLPVIRYRMNDVLELENEQCSCGSAFTQIKRIHGRKDDIFHFSNPTGSTVYLFPDYVRRSINQASDKIMEYQAIQIASNKIIIKLQFLEKTTEEEISAIQAKISSNLSVYLSKIDAVPPDIEYRDEAPERNPRSGKLIRVIRRGIDGN